MKQIDNLIFEIKVNKVNKNNAKLINEQFKSSVIHVVDKVNGDKDIAINDIHGKVIGLIILNNKCVIRVQFENRNKILNETFEFKKLSNGLFVLAASS